MNNRFTLTDLAAIIEQRGHADADRSYTRSLLDGGAERVARKFAEEAIETVIATVQCDRSAIVREAADVLYHLLVLLHASGVGVDEVMDELAGRTARSGHEEKASRRKNIQGLANE
jgi:phosphoribosyl-ATP pyrophosphohydrolase